MSTTAEPRNQFAYWVGLALRMAREAANIHRASVAGRAGVGERTIERLEDGYMQDDIRRYTLGQDFDGAIVAYAYELGVEDARDFLEHILAEALRLWREDSGRPIGLADPKPVAGGHAIDALRRLQQARASGSGNPSVGRRRRREGR